MAEELKKRSEVAVENTWKLEDIYKDKAEWEAELKEIEKIVGRIESMKGKLCESGKSLYAYFCDLELFAQKIEKAYNYSSRLSDQDTKNTENQALDMKMESFYNSMNEKMSFTEPEILAGLTAKLDELYKDEPKLHEFDVEIKETLRTKDHTLSPEMENLLAASWDVLGCAGTTFGMFNNADLVFPEITDDKGEKVRITHGRYRVLLENPDVRVRKDMFENYYKMFIDYKNTLASNYQNHVKGHVFMAKARKYASAIERGVDINKVPSQVYMNLLDAV